MGKEKIEDKKFGVKIIISTTIGNLQHEVGVVNIKSGKPFVKKMIDDFISSDDFIKTLKTSVEVDNGKFKIDYFICND